MADEVPQVSDVQVNPEAFQWMAGIFEGPLLVEPSRLPNIINSLRDFCFSPSFQKLMEPELLEDGYWPPQNTWRSRYRPYAVKDGVLTIPIRGPMLYRNGDQAGRYFTGMEYVRRAVTRGMEDAAVTGILFDIQSPGSEGRGIFELTKTVSEFRGQKPMRAYAHYAFSGGFSLATAADEIVVAPSGHTGSVGVVSTHVDLSKMLEQFGVKHTFVFSGKHKVDGNAYQPLSESVQEKWQNECDRMYDTFVSTVATNRGLTEEEVRDTEAQIYDAPDSQEIGFADSMAAPEEGFTDFATQVSVAQPNRGTAMSTKATDTETAITQADIDRAVSTAKTEAATEARTEERKRWATVLDSEHYGGREALARQLLDTTDLSAEQVQGALEKAPKTEAETPPADDKGGDKGTRQNHFAEHMDKNGGADAGGNDGGDKGTKTVAETTDMIFAAAGIAPANGQRAN